MDQQRRHLFSHAFFPPLPPSATTTTEKNDISAPYLERYQNRIESELTEICNDILSLLETHLIPKVSDGVVCVQYVCVCVCVCVCVVVVCLVAAAGLG